jgi:Ca-activated chloride channel family protein
MGGLALLCVGCGQTDMSGSYPVSSSRTTGDAVPELAMDAEQAAPDASAATGRGPGQAGDRFDLIVENDFLRVDDRPLSTFSVDVDTASYAKIRQYLMQYNTLPPADAVRIEELVNYFDYDYAPPGDEHPFAVHVQAARCPWRDQHRLVRIGIQGRPLTEEQPPKNLVFLIDVSGSMNAPNKLPLVKQGLRMLVEQLGQQDRVAAVVYAGAAGLAIPPTSGQDGPAILSALNQLHAGGSTNGGEGVQLAYRTAVEQFIPGGVNRVVLCTDGDFNVGVTGTGELVRLAEQYAAQGIYLSVLGFGTGNLNDAMLEQISNRANGNYAFIDTPAEAWKVLVQEVGGTLVTIAKDVKIQVEFNPAQVAAYRLIGYETRRLADQDFRDDRKDAGEIGAGHRVTALYELVLAGQETDAVPAPVDALKYQSASNEPSDEPSDDDAQASEEWLTVRLRYKLPDQDHSTPLSVALAGSDAAVEQMPDDFRFAAAVGLFGMVLRDSAYRNDADLQLVYELAAEARGEDRHGYRVEFLDLVRRAAALRGESLAGGRSALGFGTPVVGRPYSGPPAVGRPAIAGSKAILLVCLGLGLGVCLTAIAAGLCLGLLFRAWPPYETRCVVESPTARPPHVGIPPGRPTEDRWAYGASRLPEKQRAG